MTEENKEQTESLTGIVIFKTADKDFVLDKDCARAVGKFGPKTLNEMRNLLGIPIPEFGEVNLNEEENKIQVKK